ncbi:MAG: hypothetical protein M1150_03530 [Patescibacteria group bacterium]|nr:hypothetical protein [Patescibacteria group bacterium]
MNASWGEESDQVTKALKDDWLRGQQMENQKCWAERLWGFCPGKDCSNWDASVCREFRSQ